MISSRQNPLLRRYRRLHRSRRAREDEGAFVVEGIQPVVEAVERGAAIETLLYAPDLLTSAIALDAIERAAAAGVRVEPLSAELFAAISARDNPVGIAAIVARRLLRLDELEVQPGAVMVALVGAGDPGNVGTVLRTIDASGADALILVGPSVDPFHPTVARASVGTLFTVPIATTATTDALLAWAAADGLHPLATSDAAERDLWSVDFPRPLLLVMGSEGEGLPDQLLAAMPTVRIPMAGHADSLNLGVATALILYEIRRRERGSA